MTLLLPQSRLWLLSLLLLCAWPVPSESSTDRSADQIVGRWLFPSKGSSVDIFRSEGRYFVRVAETDSAGRTNFGLVKDSILISKLTFDGQTWSGGELIHPKTGMHLDVELRMNAPHSITVVVFKGLKFIGKKFVMTRKPA